MKKEEKANLENEESELCPKCGNMMVEEDGEMVCPDCDNQIDFFGEDNE